MATGREKEGEAVYESESVREYKMIDGLFWSSMALTKRPSWSGVLGQRKLQGKGSVGLVRN